MSCFSFEVLKSCPGTHARRGRMLTPHGPVETPAFMPVGTQATVKTLTPRELREVGAGIILGNTYHLYLRPGMEVIREAGGLHRFMSWDGPILTDSGGFQIFSLQKLRDLREEGAFFRSHIDGSSHLFTPESVVDIQHILGSDIMMPLDECLPYPSEREYARASLERTHRWAGRALEHHGKSSSGGEQALFGIVQGGMFRDLREESARALVAMDFPGYSIGGLSVGESKEVMHEVLDWTIPLLPGEKPRYLMGVGTPEDFFECISRGVDIFDCVLPTRIARNGTVMTSQGKLVLKNARHRMDFSPLDPECSCSVCRGYSRSYLRHLFIADEILGPRLTTYHNLYFLENLMSNIRLSLEEGRFTEFRDAFMEKYRGDLAPDGGSRPE